MREQLGHLGHARALFEASLVGEVGGGGDVGPPPQEAAGTTAHHRQEALRVEFTHSSCAHAQDSAEQKQLLRLNKNRVGSLFVGLHRLLDHVYADRLKALNPSGLSDKTDLMFPDYTSATMEAKARERRVWPGVLRATQRSVCGLACCVPRGEAHPRSTWGSTSPRSRCRARRATYPRTSGRPRPKARRRFASATCWSWSVRCLTRRTAQWVQQLGQLTAGGDTGDLPESVLWTEYALELLVAAGRCAWISVQRLTRPAGAAAASADSWWRHRLPAGVRAGTAGGGRPLRVDDPAAAVRR